MSAPESEPESEKGQLPVWFYIGALLGTYGVLLTGAGIYQFWNPPSTVLAEYHATFWGGLLLLAIGGTYLAIYRPKQGQATRSR